MRASRTALLYGVSVAAFVLAAPLWGSTVALANCSNTGSGTVETPASNDVIVCGTTGGPDDRSIVNPAADGVSITIDAGATVDVTDTVPFGAPAVDLRDQTAITVAGNLINKSGVAVNAGESLTLLLLSGGTITSETDSQTIIASANSHLTIGGTLNFGSGVGSSLVALAVPGVTNSINLSGSNNRVTLLSGYSIAGNVIGGSVGGTNNVLEFGGPVDASFAVSDIGPLQLFSEFTNYEKTGTSTWTLTGTTAAVLPFSLLGGTLAISSDGNLGAPGGSLTFDGGTLQTTADISSARPITLNAGGGTLNTDGGTTFTITGTVGGVGGLTKVGNGTLTFAGTGTATYGGPTAVTAGTVAGGAANAFSPNSAFTIAGAAFLDLAGFGQAIGSLAGGGTVTNSGPGAPAALTTGGDDTSTTFSGTVQDGASPTSLTKAGTGTFTLTGANTFTGGTTINAGVLQVGDGENAGSITGNVTTNAVLAFNRADAVAFPGTISGTGAVLQLGSGTLRLTGPNTYSGGTGIAAGTVIGSATSFGSGPIANAGSLVIDQPSDAAFGNAISGAGTFTKQGAGLLNLTGTSTLTGPTTVAAGTLAVNGSLPNSVVTVNSGATLGGNGTVGGIVALGGSTVAPGNSIGQLNVTGNVSFAAGSNFAVEINAAGGGDRIVATGSATLTGGTVAVTAEAGNYAPSQRYTILTANGGVSGRFTNLVTTSNLAFLSPALGYDPNNVFIFFTTNGTPFVTIAETRNQIATCGGIQGLGAGALFGALQASTAANGRRACDVSSGEIHASAVTAQFITADIIRNAVLDRLRGGFGTGVGYGPDPRFGPIPGTPGVPAAFSADLPGRRGTVPVPMRIVDPQVFAMWGLGFGSFGSTRTDGNAGTMTRGTGGFILGADATLDGAYRFGLAGGYTNTNIDVTSRLSRGSIESGYGVVYAGATLGPFAARLGAEYAGNSLDLRRNVAFAGFADSERARYGGSTKQVFGEFGYRFGIGPGFLEPIAGAAGVWVDRDRFTEAGGAAALFAPRRGQQLGTATVGVRGEFVLGDNSPFSLRGLAAYRRAFGDVVPTALLGFTAGTGQTFTIAGVPVDRNAFVGEFGLDWRVADGMTVGLLYMGQVGARAEDHGLKGDFVWRF